LNESVWLYKALLPWYPQLFKLHFQSLFIIIHELRLLFVLCVVSWPLSVHNRLLLFYNFTRVGRNAAVWKDRAGKSLLLSGSWLKSELRRWNAEFLCFLCWCYWFLNTAAQIALISERCSSSLVRRKACWRNILVPSIQLSLNRCSAVADCSLQLLFLLFKPIFGLRKAVTYVSRHREMMRLVWFQVELGNRYFLFFIFEFSQDWAWFSVLKTSRVSWMRHDCLQKMVFIAAISASEYLLQIFCLLIKARLAVIDS